MMNSPNRESGPVMRRIAGPNDSLPMRPLASGGIAFSQ